MGLKDSMQELIQLIERRNRITDVLSQLEESKEPQAYMEVGHNMVTRATLSDAAKQEFDYIAERFQGMLQIEVTAVCLDIDRVKALIHDKTKPHGVTHVVSKS